MLEVEEHAFAADYMEGRFFVYYGLMEGFSDTRTTYRKQVLLTLSGGDVANVRHLPDVEQWGAN